MQIFVPEDYISFDFLMRLRKFKIGARCGAVVLSLGWEGEDFLLK